MVKQKEAVFINNLWRSRHASGLEQKQVADLLGHRSNDAVSRYERGICLPNLKNIIKLIIIYQTPFNQLFPEHFQCYRAQLESRMRTMPESIIPRMINETLNENIHHCTYEKLLKKSPPTKNELNLVRDHITTLAKAHAHF